MGFVGGRSEDLKAPSEATLRALAARHLDDARRHHIEAAKCLDQLGEGRCGWHVACSTDALDDARALLTERAPDVPSGRRQ